jgi:aminocarboxymuconate-semialdehyde decarboxylase
MSEKYRISVDAHWHHIPEDIVRVLRNPDNPSGERVVRDEKGADYLTYLGQRQKHPVTTLDTSVDLAIQELDQRGVSMAVMSPAASLFFYHLDPAITRDLAQTINDGLVQAMKRYPKRLAPIGTVPLQDHRMAIAELERIMALGLYGAEIETHCNDWNLDAPELFPFFERAAELGAFILIHPINVLAPDRLSSHYLINLIGNPTETCIAFESLLFGQVYDRVPKLVTCFCHGGGSFPYLLGRADRAYKVRPECRQPSRLPSEYKDRIWCDSLTHSADARAYLVAALGASQVVLGTDYPYDMGDEDPLKSLEATPGLSQDDRRSIAGETMARLLQLKN